MLVGLAAIWYGYNQTYAPNVKCPDSSCDLFIKTGSDFETVIGDLDSLGYLIDSKSFRRLAKLKKYPARIKPGRYILSDGMDNNQLVNLLRSGNQTPVRVTFNNIDRFSDLAGVVSRQIEADSIELLTVFTSDSAARKYGFNRNTFSAMFMANTYEFYWNTSSSEFVERMAVEFNRFWTSERKAKAAELNLEQSEVVTLASIVEKETVKVDEMPIVAGLYLNRIRNQWPLQADPTVIFAIEQVYPDSQITRVLNAQLEFPSPYNTYKNSGLPPGPIGFPSVKAIDAVLYAEDHNYMYMCASADNPGYHKFAVTYDQHKRNSRDYQRWLNARGIMR